MTPMRLLPTLVMVALLGPSAAAAVEFVRIASWNIEHLGRRTPGQRPIAFAEHLTLAGPDVIVLQEIYDSDEESGARTNDTLDTMFAMLNERDDHDWDCELFPMNNPNSTQQLTGVAWNKERVSLVGEAMQIEVEDHPAQCERYVHLRRSSLPVRPRVRAEGPTQQ